MCRYVLYSDIIHVLYFVWIALSCLASLPGLLCSFVCENGGRTGLIHHMSWHEVDMGEELILIYVLESEFLPVKPSSLTMQTYGFVSSSRVLEPWSLVHCLK